MSCHSVAEVLTLVQTKQIRINIHKRNSTKNTVNTSTHISKTPKHCKTPTYTNSNIAKQVKTTTVQRTPKWNSHNTIKYPQCKVTLMYMTILSPRTSPYLTSLHFISHKSTQFTPHHYTAHHFAYFTLLHLLHITSLTSHYFNYCASLRLLHITSVTAHHFAYFTLLQLLHITALTSITGHHFAYFTLLHLLHITSLTSHYFTNCTSLHLLHINSFTARHLITSHYFTLSADFRERPQC